MATIDAYLNIYINKTHIPNSFKTWEKHPEKENPRKIGINHTEGESLQGIQQSQTWPAKQYQELWKSENKNLKPKKKKRLEN